MANLLKMRKKAEKGAQAGSAADAMAKADSIFSGDTMVGLSLDYISRINKQIIEEDSKDVLFPVRPGSMKLEQNYKGNVIVSIEFDPAEEEDAKVLSKVKDIVLKFRDDSQGFYSLLPVLNMAVKAVNAEDKTGISFTQPVRITVEDFEPKNPEKNAVVRLECKPSCVKLSADEAEGTTEPAVESATE